MSYATNTEVIARIGSAKLCSLHAAASPVEAYLKASRREAASLMNGYLAAQLVTPVDTIEHDHLWERLRDTEIGIVKHKEFCRDDVANVPEIVKAEYDAAIEWLGNVGKRKVILRRGGGQAGSVDLLRGDARAIVETINAEFNYLTASGSGTGAAEFGDTDETAGFVAQGDGSLWLMGFRQYDAMSTGSVEITPMVNGTAVTGDDVTLTWDSGHSRGRVRWDSGPGFSEGDLVGIKIVRKSTVPASKAVKIMLGYYYG